MIKVVIQYGLMAGLFLYAAAIPVSLSLVNAALGLLLVFTIADCPAKAGRIENLTSQAFDFKSEIRNPKSKIQNGILPPSIFLILIFFLWTAITTWINRGSFQWSDLSSFSKIWNFLPYCLIPLAFKISKPKIETILKVTASTACIIVILGTVQYFTGIHYFFEGWFNKGALVGQQRFHGFQSHALHAGAVYSMLFLAACGKVLMDQHSSIKNRIFWFFAAIILAVGMLLTGSRSYYLGSAVGLLILLVFRGWKSLVLGVFASLIFVFIFSRSVPYIAERIKTIQASKTDESGRQRLWAWKTALLIIQDHPLLGVGYRNWRNHLQTYAARLPDWTSMDPAIYGHAHNSYLTITAETGLIGLVIFMSFWIGLLFEQWRLLFSLEKDTISYALTLSTIACIGTVMTAGLFEHNLLTAFVSLTLFFMIGLSKANRELREDAKKPEVKKQETKK